MTTASTPGLRRLARPRLYEQVAEQITIWIAGQGLKAGDKLLPERDLAKQLGVSRATVSQALVALEVIGVVAVRHGDGAVITENSGTTKIMEALREHAKRMPEVIDARDALESKLAALAAERHTAEDMDLIDSALDAMEADLDEGGRGVAGDEQFHAAVTAAAHSSLLAKMMAEISDLIVETRLESLAQPGRPRASLAAHRTIADAIRAGDAASAAEAMHVHVDMVSDVTSLRR
jgi:GntR family transcriptional repressor for pyruvate dehydrogenase complex